MPAPPPADRLRQALTTLRSSASDSPERVTVSALCQLANVSRNSLYRYHPIFSVPRRLARTRRLIAGDSRLMRCMMAADIRQE